MTFLYIISSVIAVFSISYCIIFTLKYNKRMLGLNLINPNIVFEDPKEEEKKDDVENDPNSRIIKYFSRGFKG